MFPLRRRVTLIAITLLIWDVLGFVFPSMEIHAHMEELKIESISTSQQLSPTLATWGQLLIIWLMMSYDFALFMSCVLNSTKMLIVWIYGAPVRILVSLATAVGVVIVLKDDHIILASLTSAHKIIMIVFAAVGLSMAVPYWRVLRLSNEAQELKEKRRRLRDVEQLRRAAAAATLTRHQENLEAVAGIAIDNSDDSDEGDADGKHTLYVRAEPVVHSYAYIYQRDFAYTAPKIAY